MHPNNTLQSHADASDLAINPIYLRMSPSKLSGTHFPARNVGALPALTVTAEVRSNTARHGHSSGMSSLSGLSSHWSVTSIPSRPRHVAGQFSSYNESTAVLQPLGTKHQRAKSAGSSTTVSSQPVVVRTYMGSRGSSRNGSPHPTTIPRNMSRRSHLPPTNEFSFDAVLRAVEPEIQSAIDAIAEICARSRMSLADEHEAHIPPQGEIRESEPSWIGRQHGGRQGWRMTQGTLTAVPEASSSSERLAGGSKASSESGKGKNSAYGSLKEIITGKQVGHWSEGEGDASESTFVGEASSSKKYGQYVTKTGNECQNTPSTALISPATASKQLSFDTPTAEPLTLADPLVFTSSSGPGKPRLHGRSGSGSLTSWLPWPRFPAISGPASGNSERLQAETRLKSLLQNTTAPIT
ncbi:hypothetical protein EJ05DRAFT_138513 [Pseudovirgaria hyperparasitica]|uniref:Uncharacterized protein n=1 Tax=Pseudovirgaria hyperparasitica TaxID=470096 RepID=A0A6A6VXM9_9PEZI|nr:uncharacterized protein EJ05DRAFT_138513 [Pseudovirgaria hyperparasitica]KAF2754935.1 hypothetical protein EJ05DRAFT_138513 [Pseudovirgaria hyperparasitica]